MESLGALSVFVQVADTGSFTATARQLSVSPSAVGKAVSRLESDLGVRLFHRSTRSQKLTPEGEMFLQRCRRILTEMEAAEAELADTQKAPKGRLRVSLPLINELTAPILWSFMETNPEVQLDIDYSDRFVDIIEEGFDVVVRAGELSDSRLMRRPMGAFELKLVAASDYLARRGRPARPDELISHDCLLHRFATSGKFEPWPLRDWSTEEAVYRQPRMIANTIEPLVSLAERGAGIACLPRSLVARQLGDGRLETVLDDFTGHRATMWMLWPASRYPSPKLRVFLDHMAKHFGQG